MTYENLWQTAKKCKRFQDPFSCTLSHRVSSARLHKTWVDGAMKGDARVCRKFTKWCRRSMIGICQSEAREHQKSRRNLRSGRSGPGAITKVMIRGVQIRSFEVPRWLRQLCDTVLPLNGISAVQLRTSKSSTMPPTDIALLDILLLAVLKFEIWGATPIPSMVLWLMAISLQALLPLVTPLQTPSQVTEVFRNDRNCEGFSQFVTRPSKWPLLVCHGQRPLKLYLLLTRTSP